MKATRMQEMCKSCTNLWGKSTTKNATKSGMLTMGVCQRNLYKLHTRRMRNMCVCVCVRACKIIASVSVFSVLWHADSDVGEWQGRGTVGGERCSSVQKSQRGRLPFCVYRNCNTDEMPTPTQTLTLEPMPTLSLLIDKRRQYIWTYICIFRSQILRNDDDNDDDVAQMIIRC